jgi:hypothetical protein
MVSFDTSGLYEMATYFEINSENYKLNIFLQTSEENSAEAVAPFFMKT